MSLVRRHLQAEEGATAVEFALVLPVLMSILFGIIAFGQYFAIANSLQQFAAEAVRYSVSEPFMADREARANSFLNSPGERFAFLDGSKISRTVSTIGPVTENGLTVTALQITLTYDLSGTAVDIADRFLGIGIADITRSSYLAY
ncbi:TadE/TadG family type IV pilus assembly protein [Celeribacter sp. SCSIO 80788]|uniref:TadE/TadG family type IV pilus assembly protein n=1 Tax=Celeribacter sp. SCSIO 80788 TaxID=3117013 RepID=UPI003DA275A8